MAEIFLAVDVGGSLERLVVIKRLLPQHADEPERIAMFRREARYLAGLEHPNVVRIHELAEDDGVPYLVLEYIEGLTARSVFGLLEREGLELPIPALVSLGAQACAGLQAAHELRDLEGKPVGLIHRDISPDNLMVSAGGLVTVLDFGIATSHDRRSVTAVGSVRGKVGYLSPEQCRGNPVDARSDLFSLGTVLWELTTGQRLFDREGDLDVLEAITAGAVPSASSLRPDTPPELDEVLRRALAVRPEERFASAAEMRRALLAVLESWRPPDASAGQDALASFVRDHADWLLEKRRGLRREAIDVARRGAVPTGELPLALPSESVELASVPGPPPARTSWVLLPILLGAAALLGILYAIAASTGPRSSGEEPAPIPSTAAPAPATTRGPGPAPEPGSEGSAAAAQPTTAVTGPVLRIGWPPFFDPDTLRAELEPFEEYLSGRLGRPVEFVLGTNYDEVLELLESGQVEAASLPPALYLSAREATPGLVPLAVREEDGRADYDALLLVRSDAAYATLADTEGATFCFTDPHSTSGYVLPRLALRDAGYDPDAFVGEVRWSGGHLLALRDVLDGACDVVATYNGALVSADRQGIRVSRLRPLALTGQVPQDVMVASPAMPAELRVALQGALESLDPRSDLGVERVGEVLRLTGYAPFDPAPFEALARSIASAPRL